MEEKSGILAEMATDEPANPPKVVLKRPAKKVKEPEVHTGKIVLYCKERGYMGFECDGHDYQMPIADGYKVGDAVKFVVNDGMVVLCE